MTSFDSLETSTESSEPIELYTITVGSLTYRYTSGSVAITIGADTWVPEPIRRSRIVKSKERKEVLKITFASDNVFAKSFLGMVPGTRGYVSIIRVQRDEAPTFNTQILIYKGQVSLSKYASNGDEIELSTRSIEAATTRSVPRFTFMGMCNHILFDNGCKQTTSGFTVTGAVSSVTEATYTVAGLSAKLDGFFTGGWCTPVGTADFRMVLAHSGDNITLLLPFAEDLTGVDLEVFAGCDHILTSDCANKFDNVLEFGGFAFVPNKNPFATGL